MLNDYAEQLSGHTRVFSAVAPLSSAFIPAVKYKHLYDKNRITLDSIRYNLSENTYFCDVLGAMNRHKHEYIYFKTDHHWTALGAYYGYGSFCDAAGIEPMPLESMDTHTKYNFLGSLYYMTLDKSVKQNADTFIYYVPKVETQAVYYRESGFTAHESETFSDRYSGGNCYMTFLQGDHPLMKITTNVKNGKKIIVIKDSMGNAFSVFLVSHYEEIWIMDYRYSKHNLINLIKDNNITDMVFAVGMYAAVSKGTIKRMARLGTQNYKEYAK
jgi:hypothetical protein